MAVRGTFAASLEELKIEVMLLGSMVRNSLTETMEAFETGNYSRFEQMIEQDQTVNELEQDINDEATLLIARQQPVASDLRRIIVMLKISSDLERVGDLAVDMSKAAKRIRLSEMMEEHRSALIELAAKADYMLKEVLHAYKERNVLRAQQIAGFDDDVDRAYGEFVKSIFNVAVSEKKDIQQITQMAFISRYIERIADYATNIAEWIIYEVNGQRFDLN
ncbi:phosphate transport system regulatory protein PhoU [Alteribacter lacisalsi]|uniref:Phosphate-specific transport system accessory protein PhoU n=1 Tax=Alteribacter lacisalsi TaxID=2045244 RepID=A0A2W0H9C1_9BACI|nr:phosphate signaling complex protein PhoU [Alteribacter lacisalsi]PYZ97366.1 phosphate transport system regulatory protein PhoU [Alteribacter lacisalsi]